MGTKSMMRDLVKKLIPEALGKEIEKVTRGFYPIQNCLIRKVKMVKKPKFDLTKLIELHSDSLKDDVAPRCFGRRTRRRRTLLRPRSRRLRTERESQSMEHCEF